MQSLSADLLAVLDALMVEDTYTDTQALASTFNRYETAFLTSVDDIFVSELYPTIYGSEFPDVGLAGVFPAHKPSVALAGETKYMYQAINSIQKNPSVIHDSFVRHVSQNRQEKLDTPQSPNNVLHQGGSLSVNGSTNICGISCTSALDRKFVGDKALDVLSATPLEPKPLHSEALSKPPASGTLPTEAILERMQVSVHASRAVVGCKVTLSACLLIQRFTRQARTLAVATARLIDKRSALMRQSDNLQRGLAYSLAILGYARRSASHQYNLFTISRTKYAMPVRAYFAPFCFDFRTRVYFDADLSNKNGVATEAGGIATLPILVLSTPASLSASQALHFNKYAQPDMIFSSAVFRVLFPLIDPTVRHLVIVCRTAADIDYPLSLFSHVSGVPIEDLRSRLTLINPSFLDRLYQHTRVPLTYTGSVLQLLLSSPDSILAIRSVLVKYCTVENTLPYFLSNTCPSDLEMAELAARLRVPFLHPFSTQSNTARQYISKRIESSSVLRVCDATDFFRALFDGTADRDIDKHVHILMPRSEEKPHVFGDIRFPALAGFGSYYLFPGAARDAPVKSPPSLFPLLPIQDMEQPGPNIVHTILSNLFARDCQVVSLPKESTNQLASYTITAYIESSDQPSVIFLASARHVSSRIAGTAFPTRGFGYVFPAPEQVYKELKEASSPILNKAVAEGVFGLISISFLHASDPTTNYVISLPYAVTYGSTCLWEGFSTALACAKLSWNSELGTLTRNLPKSNSETHTSIAYYAVYLPFLWHKDLVNVKRRALLLHLMAAGLSFDTRDLCGILLEWPSQSTSFGVLGICQDVDDILQSVIALLTKILNDVHGSTPNCVTSALVRENTLESESLANGKEYAQHRMRVNASCIPEALSALKDTISAPY